ncbi:MAG: chalcone isomerase family protein [Burkholderiaceae bacterium]
MLEPLRLNRRAASSLLAATPFASAALAGDAPQYVAHYIPNARTAGEGRLTWFGLLIYTARLHVAADGIDLANLDSQRFALELTYARRLDGKAIAERNHDEMALLHRGTDEQRGDWLRQMTRIFPGVAAGQTLIGVHLDSGATRFYCDGTFIGSVDDPAFSSAFFAIWLDPQTRAPKLRTALLQRAAR